MLQPDEVAKLMQRNRLDKFVGGKRVVVVGKPSVIDAVEDHVRPDDRVVVGIHRERHRQRAADLRLLVVDPHGTVGRGLFHPVNDVRAVLAVDVHAGQHQAGLLEF